MDAWLAQIYGTGGASDTDIEKTAQSMLLEKLAAAEGIDISGLTPEQVSGLAAEVLPTEEEEVQQQQAAQQPVVAAPPTLTAPQGMVAQAGEGASEEEVSEDKVKEAQSKFEEADFLGRVMAHAYTQELEKIAGFGMNVAKGHMRDAGRAIKGGAEKAYGATRSHLSSNKGKYIAGAGAGAAGFAAGRMSKEASIFIEKLAEIRAAEILQENGIDPATGKPVQQQTAPVVAAAQQTQQAPSAIAQPQQEVQQAVDQRAVDMLKAAGYTFA
jgi:hypothetical protein